MCQDLGVENGSSVFGGWLHRWSGRWARYSTTAGWMSWPAAQASQSPADARRCRWTSRFTSAEAIGRASAWSVARFPAPITTEPGGSS